MGYPPDLYRNFFDSSLRSFYSVDSTNSCRSSSGGLVAIARFSTDLLHAFIIFFETIHVGFVFHNPHFSVLNPFHHVFTSIDSRSSIEFKSTAIATSVAAVTLIALIVFFIYRRHTRAAQRRKALSIAFPDSPFAWEREPGVQDDDKPWAPPGSGWPAPEELSLPVPVIPVPRPTTAERERIRRPSSHSLGARGGAHYIVRSHASVGDVYGFGQDLAWQEAHYEDVVPLSSGAPIPISPLALGSSSIGIVPVSLPPTLRPSSGGAAATPLLRNTSHASILSESSVYSRPSMAMSPSPSPPRHVPVLTRVEDAIQ
ncbi:hypothetical protein C8R46DRAFT_1042516 [Mycena filopes]|nr:hypothetical protein C8R46DRAFT_1042516 [Mycena filopes]